MFDDLPSVTVLLMHPDQGRHKVDDLFVVANISHRTGDDPAQLSFNHFFSFMLCPV